MATENMIKFLRGNVASLPATATAGAVYFTKDEGLYLGLEDGSYHRYGDFITVANVDSLPAAGAHETCMYYCESENILAKWDGEKWVQINKQKTLAELGGIAKSVYDAKMVALEKADTDNATAIAGVDTRLQAAEKKLESVATTDGLAELAGTVANHTTAINTINGDVNTAGSMLKIAKDAADGKDAAIKEAKDAADKAQGDVDALTQTHATDKAALEGAIALKANAADVYTKTDVDGKVDTINAAIDLKAAAADVYTKGEVDGMVDTLEAADLAINNLIGDVTEGKTVVEMIADAKTAATYNDAEVRGLIGANTDAIAKEVEDREGAVSGLKTELEGKIAEKVAQSAYDTKVAALVAEDERLAGLIGDMDEAYKAADADLDGRIAALESDITGLSGAMHFKGVVEALPETTEGYNDGDTIIVGQKEYVVNGEAFVELGDVSAEVQRITDLEGVVGDANSGLVKAIADEKARAEGAEADLAAADATNLQAAKDYADAAVEALNIAQYAKQTDLDGAVTRIGTAEGKITALETASATHALKTEVEAVSTALEEYKTAHASDYTNAQIDAAIDADVKVVADELDAYKEAHASDYTNEQINNAIANAGHASAADLATHTGNADVHVTTDDKAKWNAAQANAEATAAAALATARTEISAEIDADVLVEANRAKGVEEGLQSAIDTHVGNGDIHVTVADKEKWNKAQENAEKTASDALIAALTWGSF